MRLGLVNYYRMCGAQVHFPRNTDPPENSEPLGSYAECFHYGLLDGRKIRSINHPESKHTSIGSSIIQIQFQENIFAGEVLTIFRHKQDGVLDPDLRNKLLCYIKWMKPTKESPLDPTDDEGDAFVGNNL
jgi:hypothetical protein